MSTLYLSGFCAGLVLWLSFVIWLQGGARRERAGGTGSVQEALTGLLPAAGRAPLVPVLDAVHLPALLSLPAGFPVTQESGGYRHALRGEGGDLGQGRPAA